MIILGLDPGLARTGFGLIDLKQPSLFLSAGCLTTSSEQAKDDRLHSIGQDLATLIKKYQPNHAVVETILFGKNTKTAVMTAETRGALVYLLRDHHIPITSLTPLQIKSRITGYGAADKQQIQHVVTTRLKLSSTPEPDDAADALAAALCLADQPSLV